MRQREQHGSAVLFSLSVVVLLATLGSTLLVRSLNENQVGLRSAARHSALYLAEAGVDQALLNLRTPADLTDDINTGTLLTGTFRIDTPPVSVGAQTWKVTAHGTSSAKPSDTRHVEAVFQLAPLSVFQYALFAKESLKDSGHAQTDSFDSRLGAYQDDANKPGYNKTQRGNVGTNSTAAGGITVGGSIFIEGQVVVGPNVADPTSVVSGYDPAFITGNPKVVSEPSVFPMPAVTVPAGLTCSKLKVEGQTTVTLSPTGGPLGNGTYCYSELELKGGATFTASGPVTIYLTGELEVEGNATVGVPAVPKNMLFLMSPSAEAVLKEEQGTITGSTQFYGAIYGPDAELTITGHAEIFGSVIAKKVTISGSAQLHYDEALTDVTQVSNQFQTSLLSWREVAS